MTTPSWIGSHLPPINRHGEDYFLVSHNLGFYLVVNRCPHRGAALKSGYLDAEDKIICPLHRGAFALCDLIAQPSTIKVAETQEPVS